MALRRAMVAWLSVAGIMALAGLGTLEASADLQARSWTTPDASRANAIDFESLITEQGAPERVRLSKRSRSGMSRAPSRIRDRRLQPEEPVLSDMRLRLPSLRSRQAAMETAESTSDGSNKPASTSDTDSEFSEESMRSSSLVDEPESLSESSSDERACAGSPNGVQRVTFPPIASQPRRTFVIDGTPEMSAMESLYSVQSSELRSPNPDLSLYRQMSIAAVQSEFYRSPFEGHLVAVTGVVTMIRPRDRFQQLESGVASLQAEPIGTFLESIDPHVVYLQTPDKQWDRDYRKSEALMVRLAPAQYTDDTPNELVPGGVAVGDTIEVYGTVAEERWNIDSLLQTVITQVVRVNVVFRGESDSSSSQGDSAVRRLQAVGLTPVTLNAPRTVPAGLPRRAFYQPTRQIFLPDPYDLSIAKQVVDDVIPPLMLNPSERGIDFFKTLEHMVIRIRAPVVLGPQIYNGVVVLADEGKYSSGLAPNGPVVAMARNESAGQWVATYPERIEVVAPLDGTRRPKVNAGDRLDDVVGILSYSYGRYHVVPFTAYSVVAAAPGQVERLSAAPVDKYSVSAGGCRPLRVVSYNVRNLNGKQHQRIAALVSHLVSDLGMPDIIALQAIQDVDGPSHEMGMSADETLAIVVGALAVATGGRVEYAFAQIDAEDANSDNGLTFGNMRSAFLYRRDTVQLAPSVAGRAGSPNEAVRIVNSKHLGGMTLSVNPGRIGPQMEAFANSRKPLAAAFDLVGEQVRGGGASTPPKRVFVVNVHLLSRLGSAPWHSSLQPPTSGAAQNRIEQVHVLNKFRDNLLNVAANSGAAAPHLLILGDMNEVSYAPPLRQLALSSADPNGALVPVMDSLPEIQRYSYVHKGMGELIDHIFATRQLAARLRYASVLHVNTPFADDARSSQNGRGVQCKQDRVNGGPGRGTKRRAANVPSDGPVRAASRKAPRREGLWSRITERVRGALDWLMLTDAAPAEVDAAHSSVGVEHRLVRRGNGLHIGFSRPVDISTVASNLVDNVPEALFGSERPIVSNHDPLMADFDLCQ